MYGNGVLGCRGPEDLYHNNIALKYITSNVRDTLIAVVYLYNINTQYLFVGLISLQTTTPIAILLTPPIIRYHIIL